MDYAAEETQYIAFTTKAFATNIPTILAGTPVVSAYENASAVQITAGITLGVDHDGVSGLNMLTIVATAANGYESGKSYNLVITTGTVDTVSVVGVVVGSFTLERSAAAVDLANVTDGLGALKTLIDTKASPAQVNAEVVDVIRVDTVAELGAVPAATSSLMDKLNWLFMLARNEGTQTETTKTLFADDTTTPVATSTIASTPTLFTRGEYT